MKAKKLKANPQLDALVAEKVMGIVLRKSAFHDNIFFDVVEGNPVRAYSSDAAEALKVIQRVEESLNFPVTINRQPDGWQVIFWNDFTEMDGGEQRTLALAICGSALKAVDA